MRRQPLKLNFKKISAFGLQLILSGFLILILPGLVFAQTPAGKFTYIEGKVDVLRPPAIRAIPVKLGDPVFVNDIVRAKSRSRAEITFINENILRIAEKTRVEIAQYVFDEEKSSSVLRLSRGKIQAIVHEQIAKRIATFGEANRFEVHTPSAIVAARGTDFFVFHHVDVTGVLVIEGIVETHNPQFPGVAVTVTDGNTAMVPKNQAAQPVRPATEAEIEVHKEDTRPIKELPKERLAMEEVVTAEAEVAPPVEVVVPPPPVALPVAVTETPARITEIVEPPPITDILPADTTPPSVIGFPKPILSDKSSIFVFSETVNYSYTLDTELPQTGTGTSITLTPIEGQHTIVITGTDLAGNPLPKYTYTWTADYTAPVVAIPVGPPAITNVKIADFTVSATDNISAVDKLTYTYELDGVSKTTTTGLPVPLEGSHTFTVTATDEAGNTSIASYTWTADYTAPAVSFALSPRPGIVTGVTIADFRFTASDTHIGNRYYRLDGGLWQIMTDTQLSLPNLPEGKRLIEFKADDLAGNVSISETYEWFIGLRQYTLDGGVTGNLSGSILLTSEGIRAISNQPVGAWLLDYSGSYTTMPSLLNLVAGGKGYGPNSTVFDGYWLSHISANASIGNISGTSNLTYLSTTILGTGTGSVSGSYGGQWSATDLGLGTYTETPLAFVSDVYSGLYYYAPSDGYLASDGYLHALMGGISSLWGATQTKPAPVTMIGEYNAFSDVPHIWATDIYSYNYKDSTYLTYDGGLYYGFIGGVEANNSMDGRLIALYIDPQGNAGYLRGFLTGNAYPDIKMFEMDGGIYPIQLFSNVGVPSKFPPEWFNDPSILTRIEGPVTERGEIIGDVGSIGAFVDNDMNIIGEMTDRGDFLRSARPANAGIGIWQMESWGAYDSLKTSDIYMILPREEWADEGGANSLVKIAGFGSWQDNRLSGDSFGFWGSWVRGRTDIMVGETIGTYDDSLGSFSAITTGAHIDTMDFLVMVAESEGREKLGLLGFPTTDVVGGIYLSGTLPSLPETNVNLNNIRLYSKESILGDWHHPFVTYAFVTDHVHGTYSDVPLANIGAITITNKEETFYGRFGIQTGYTGYSSVFGSNNWVAEVWGMGVIRVGSTYIQGGLASLSAGTYTESPGEFSGSLAGFFFYPITLMSYITTDKETAYLRTYYGTDGYFKGIIGGSNPISTWKTTEELPSEVEIIGLYSKDVSNYPSYLNHVFSTTIYPKNYTEDPISYTTTDGGSYYGYLIGIHIDNDGSPITSLPPGGKIMGLIDALYIDPSGNAGVLMGGFRGGFDVNNRQWWARGHIYPTQLVSSIGILPKNLHGSIVHKRPSGTIAGDISGKFSGQSIRIKGQSWGIWRAGSSGRYLSLPADNWSASINADTGLNINRMEVSGTQWSGSKLAGSTIGYGANLELASTWISVGETLGTFDPTTATTGTWQAVQMGVWLETNRFLEMAADATVGGGQDKLKALNIPCVEVGRANLFGSSGDATNWIQVHMNDVIFFAPSTGGAPKIWATNSVSGNYAGNPINQSAVLSGSGLNANFNVQQWDTTNNKWLSTVTNGTGSITGGGTNVQNLDFQGAAAGTINQGAGTFSGTGAGIAK